MKRLLILLVLVVLASGCLGDGDAQAADARDAFLDNNVSSYVHEAETSYSLSAPDGPTRATTITTRSTVDRIDRRLSASIDSVTEGAGRESVSNTTTYLVNGTVYSRSVRGGNTTGWVAFGSEGEVENTWEARDELRLYERVLSNVSVGHNGTETVRGEGAHRIDVRLGDRRTELISGKFREGASFFEEGETEGFRTTVWITDDGRLLRAETRATVTLRNRETRSGETDLNVDMRFVDEFRYEDTPAVEPPREALNSTRVR
jgi:hypothetical protein